MKETRSNFFIAKYFEATEMEHHRNEFIFFLFLWNFFSVAYFKFLESD